MPISAVTDKAKKPVPPKGLAIAFVKGHTATLHPQVSSIVEKYGDQFIDLMAKGHNRFYQIERMEQDSEFYPRSVRYKFNLSGSSEATEREDFKALQVETAKEIKDFQDKLKSKIIQANKIELDEIIKKIKTLTINAFRHITKAFLIVDNGGKQLADLPVESTLREILGNHHEELLRYSGFNELKEFITAYNSAHGTALTASSLPRADVEDSLALQMLAAGDIQMEDTIETPAIHSSIAATLLAIFHHVWEKYLTQTKKNEIMLQLKKYETEIFETQATNEAQRILDNEPNLSQATVSKLIEDSTARRTRQLQSELSQLKTSIAELSKNMSKRGAANPSTNPNSTMSNSTKKKSKSSNSNQRGRKAADVENASNNGKEKKQRGRSQSSGRRNNNRGKKGSKKPAKQPNNKSK